jgi:Ca-activated chloride channel homolog
MIRWGNAEYLSLLLVLPLLVVFYRVAWARRMAALDKFGNRKLVERLTESVDRSRQKLRITLLLAGVGLLIVTLARPQWGETEQTVKRRGVDIIVALDTSLSMAAEDVKPSRLDRAKYEIRRLVDTLQGDRIGLVVFEGEAIVQCPLTLDYGAALLFLKEIHPAMVPTPGTNLCAAIEVASRGFVQTEQDYKVLILVTDGEQTLPGDPLEAAKTAGQSNIRIYTIGVGREAGSMLQYRDESGNLVYKNDPSGKRVVTKLDALTLQKIAMETRGAYKPAEEGGLDLDAIYAEIRNMEAKDLQDQMHMQYTDRFQIPLLLAIFILLIQQAMSDRRSGKPDQEQMEEES